MCLQLSSKQQRILTRKRNLKQQAQEKSEFPTDDTEWG